MAYKMSAAARAAYGQQMREVEEFCKAHEINRSRSGDSYYFELGGQTYRVSNHTVEQSDSGMYGFDFDGSEKTRASYHATRPDVEITASKTRIIEIYNALAVGKKLDSRGREV